MEPKHFNMLAVAAVVSLVTAGLVHGAYNDWSAEKVSGQKLFPAFDKDASQVGRIVLQKGKAKLTLQKKGEKHWVLMERSEFPAQLAKIRQLLVEIAAAELVEPKTEVAAKYALLELGDPAKEDAKSTLVSMSDARGKAIAEIVLGKRKVGAFGQGKAGTYVRRPGNPQTWLTNANINAPVEVTDWVDPVFFRLDPEKIASLTIKEPGAQAYSLLADPAKKGDFKFQSIPAGQKLKTGVTASGMAKAVRTLELLDVRKADRLPEGDKVVQATLVSTDGMKIDLRLSREGTDRWVAMKVVEPGKDEAVAKGIRGMAEGWAFKIADWRARQTFKSPGDVFEPIKKPEAKPEGAPGTPPQAAPPQGPEPAAGPGAGPKQ